jgi:hypothetical protein
LTGAGAFRPGSGLDPCATHEQATAPTRAAAFLQDTAEEQQRIKADVVSVAQFLLGD